MHFFGATIIAAIVFFVLNLGNSLIFGAPQLTTTAAVACTLEVLEDGRVRVHLVEPLRDVTPGQGAVFYVGDHCLGGGIIAPSALAGEESI